MVQPTVSNESDHDSVTLTPPYSARTDLVRRHGCVLYEIVAEASDDDVFLTARTY
ncbi:hypothetical protein LC1Hm_1424 [Halomicrobium sp. LC1Hm]|nr:hypothetical protein LC1Hm_1424 [Halomicrobium sp. LC1Hm]